MNSTLLKPLLNTEVLVLTTAGHAFHGWLKEITEDAIVIQDKERAPLIINANAVATISKREARR